jgi:hypothetical protein
LQTASIQKNATIDNLVATNATLTKAIADHRMNVRRQSTDFTCNNISRPIDGDLCLHLPLEYHQTSVGQSWLLLITQLQGQSWPQQLHLLFTQDRPSAQWDPSKHHGWQHLQHRTSHHCYTPHLMGYTSGHSFYSNE